MSSTSSAESVASPSALSEREDSARSRSARWTRTAEPCSESTGRPSSRLKTFRREAIEKVKLTLLQQGSHAKTLACKATEPDLKASGQDYGGKLYEPFAWLDPSTPFWRTWQRCLIEGWARFSETWPRSGMTRNGTAFQLPPLAVPTLGIASGLLPTIVANESKGSQRRRYRGSTEYRGSKMSEGLRTGESDPIYTHPTFAEGAMGYPKDWTLLETPSYQESQKSSVGQSLKRKEQGND